MDKQWKAVDVLYDLPITSRVFIVCHSGAGATRQDGYGKSDAYKDESTYDCFCDVSHHCLWGTFVGNKYPLNFGLVYGVQIR